MSYPIASVKMSILALFTAAFAIGAGSEDVKAKPAGTKPCSVETLAGDYLVTGRADAPVGVVDPTYPRAVVTEWTFDGQGNLTGFATQSHGGTITYRQPVSATYTLDPDCVGILEFSAGERPRWHLVVTKDGSEGAALRIDAGHTATRYFKKR